MVWRQSDAARCVARCADVAGLREAAGGGGAVCADLAGCATLPLRAGLTLTSADEERELVQRAEAGVRSGGESLVFYNYGIVPAPVRQWMGPAVSAFDATKQKALR